MIHHFFDACTNGYSIETLDICSILAVLFGILVIITKNPIISVLFLIGLFLFISSYLILLGLTFIGLSYLLVYVGAVSILFLFILMLINVRISELLSTTSNSIILAILISILFIYSVNNTLPNDNIKLNILHGHYLSDYYNNLDLSNKQIQLVNSKSWDGSLYYYLSNCYNIYLSNKKIYLVTSKSWDGSLSVTSHITSIGNILYSSYSIWLILTSIILLLAMVGTIVITIKQKNTSIEY